MKMKMEMETYTKTETEKTGVGNFIWFSSNVLQPSCMSLFIIYSRVIRNGVKELWFVHYVFLLYIRPYCQRFHNQNEL